MKSLFRRLFRKREIYFHEDDFCQQQLLPAEVAEYAKSELEAINQFSKDHQIPGSFGWTDIYVREGFPQNIEMFKLKREEIASIIKPVFSEYQAIYTGYSSHREQCRRTAAWGLSEDCALFIDWNSAGVVANIWTHFFDVEERSIQAAAKVIGAIGKLRPMIYTDWAWDYICPAASEEEFARLLRDKLQTISSRGDSQ